MSQKVIISGGDPGYPTYALTDTLLLNTVHDLAVQNRGGTVGATDSDYGINVYFHYMVGSPVYPGAFNQNPVTATGAFIPDYVDGLRVKANIHNPTTFAKAIPGPSSNIKMWEKLLRPTLSSQHVGSPLLQAVRPFLSRDFRYSFEQELPTKGNNLCDPFVFWDFNGDVGGPGNSNFKNKLSFNTRSFYQDANPPSTPPDTEQQLLSGFDHRNGVAPPVPQPPSNPFDNAWECTNER